MERNKRILPELCSRCQAFGYCQYESALKTAKTTDDENLLNQRHQRGLGMSPRQARSLYPVNAEETVRSSPIFFKIRTLKEHIDSQTP